MRWLLSLLILWSSMAPATTVLLQAPGSSNIEYRATLKGSAQYLSPSQVYMAQHPGAAVRDRLLLQFSEGQKAFVSRSASEARHLFEEVARMVTTEDWEPADREVLFTALLRLAQMEKDDGPRDLWLQQALLLGPEVMADRSLFPPPLLERLKQLSAQAPALNPAQNLESSEWSRLLINGTPCTRLECPRFPKVVGRVRLTFLSDKWLPQTLVMDAGSAATARPERVAWVQGGGCGQPVFQPQAQTFHDKQAFFALECAEKPAPVLAAAPALNLAPPSSEIGAPFTQAMPAPANRPFYGSKWFWIGAGTVAVAAIAIIANQNKGHEEHETTTTYGN